LASFDCGTQTITSGPALEGQWELSWNNGAHNLLFTCPSYAFELDDTGRLTDQGRRQKAEISAEALIAHQVGTRWICPTLQLPKQTQVIKSKHHLKTSQNKINLQIKRPPQNQVAQANQAKQQSPRRPGTRALLKKPKMYG
jgi:hypothetical protein